MYNFILCNSEDDYENVYLQFKNKYLNGKIYKIYNDVNNLIYIGSTTKTIHERLLKHIEASYKLKINTRIYKAIKEIGVHNFHIELIEEYPCENQYQLLNREGYYIYNLNTTNPKKGYNMKSEGLYEVLDVKIDSKKKPKFKPYKIELQKFDINIEIK